MIWEVRETKLGVAILPRQPLQCPICGGFLLLHDFRCYDERAHGFRHIDIHMKCPECGFFATFGLPISKEDWERLRKSPLHGRVLKEEAVELAEELGLKVGEGAEHLRSWGYW